MHVHEVLAARVRVVRAEGDARRVVVERAKAQLDAGAGRDRALGLPVDRRAAVVAEAVPPDVAVMARRAGCAHVRPPESGDQSREEQTEQSDLTQPPEPSPFPGPWLVPAARHQEVDDVHGEDDPGEEERRDAPGRRVPDPVLARVPEDGHRDQGRNGQGEDEGAGADVPQHRCVSARDCAEKLVDRKCRNGLDLRAAARAERDRDPRNGRVVGRLDHVHEVERAERRPLVQDLRAQLFYVTIHFAQAVRVGLQRLYSLGRQRRQQDVGRHPRSFPSLARAPYRPAQPGRNRRERSRGRSSAR